MEQWIIDIWVAVLCRFYTRQGDMASYLFTAAVLSLFISEIYSNWITMSYMGRNLTEVPRSSIKYGADVSDKIKRLKLTNNSITKIPGNRFGKYINLQFLHLDGNQFTEVSPSAFHRTAISGLFLSGNNLSCIPDLTALNNSLQDLSISRNRLHKCDRGHLYSRNMFRRLSCIRLENNNLIHMRAMSMLWSAPNLTYVNLKDNELKQILNFLNILPKLHTFDLVGNPMECSCEIKWLKLINYNGLRMLCKFDPILKTRWDTITSTELDFHCKSLTTWNLDNNSGKLKLYCKFITNLLTCNDTISEIVIHLTFRNPTKSNIAYFYPV